MKEKIYNVFFAIIVLGQLLISFCIQVESEELKYEGLIGYYFEDSEMENLLFLSPTEGKDLFYSIPSHEKLPVQFKQFKSIVWEGEISLDNSQEVILGFSDDEFCKIFIDDLLVSNNGYDKKSVSFLENQSKYIRIEYIPNTQLSEKDMQKNPASINISGTKRNKNISTITTFKNSSNSRFIIDSDNDGIPDDLEINGYTIQNRSVVKWAEELEALGYKKFVSNPNQAHTAGDPYTDLEKARRDIDPSNSDLTFNPMIAAYPKIAVSVEKYIISENKTLSDAFSSNVSSSVNSANSLGINVQTGVSLLGPSISVTGDYHHSTSTGNGWASTNGNTSSFNKAQRAYLNANIRYHNLGTATIYNVKPTSSLIINNQTIATIRAQDNTTALALSGGDIYPSKFNSPIALTTLDSFNSKPIELNNNQYENIISDFLTNKNSMLIETEQSSGNFKIINSSGSLVNGGSWEGYQKQIENRTAQIIFSENEAPTFTEVHFAAKDPANPEDKTPVFTIGEALKQIDSTVEIVGNVLYKDRVPIQEEMLRVILDDYTHKKVEEQMKTAPNLRFLDIKLEPKMKLDIKYPRVDLIEHIDNFQKLELMELEWGIFSSNEEAPCGNEILSAEYNNNYTVELASKPTLNSKLEIGNIYSANVLMRSTINENLNLITRVTTIRNNRVRGFKKNRQSVTKDYRDYNQTYIYANNILKNGFGFEIISKDQPFAIGSIYYFKESMSFDKAIKDKIVNIPYRLTYRYSRSSELAQDSNPKIQTVQLEDIRPFQNLFTSYKVSYKKGDKIISETILDDKEVQITENGQVVLVISEKDFALPINSDYSLEVFGITYNQDTAHLSTVEAESYDDLPDTIIKQKFMDYKINKNGSILENVTFSNISPQLNAYFSSYRVEVTDMSQPIGMFSHTVTSKLYATNQLLLRLDTLPKKIVTKNGGNLTIIGLTEDKREIVLLTQTFKE